MSDDLVSSIIPRSSLGTEQMFVEDGDARDWLDLKQASSEARAAARKLREKTRLEKWARSHPDKVRAKNEAYNFRHPEKIAEVKKAYRLAHPEKVRSQKMAWRNDPQAKSSLYFAHEFIAIDSEGQKYDGDDIWKKDGLGNDVCYPDHGTYMWCAMGKETPLEVAGRWLHPLSSGAKCNPRRH